MSIALRYPNSKRPIAVAMVHSSTPSWRKGKRSKDNHFCSIYLKLCKRRYVGTLASNFKYWMSLSRMTLYCDFWLQESYLKLTYRYRRLPIYRSKLVSCDSLDVYVTKPVHWALNERNTWIKNQVFFKYGLIIVCFCLRPKAKDLGISWVVVVLIYFRPFHITIQLQIDKSIDVLGIPTRGLRMVGTDGSSELWRPP